VTALFHVSSAGNRESIRTGGLDWRLMGASPGIAGSSRPEVDGVFLCRDEAEWRYFVRLNNTGGPVDVWSVTGVEASTLVDNGNGYGYLPFAIPPGQLALTERDVAVIPRSR
jgi:hypothetical protein